MKTMLKSKFFRFGVFLLLNLMLFGWLLFGSPVASNLASPLFPLGGGDTCVAAPLITGAFPYNDTGTTVGQADDYDLPGDVTNPTCIAAGTATGAGPAGALPRGAVYTGTGTAPDAAYSLMTDRTCTLKVTLSPTAGTDLSLIVYLAQCSSSLNDCLVVDDTGTGGVAEVVYFEAVGLQTYYIIADGYSTGGVPPGPSGPYTLDIVETSSTGCVGIGPWPEIAVSAGGGDIADGAGTVDFGLTPVGTPVDVTFTVDNNGGADLTLVEPISLPAGFSVQSSFGALTVPAGGSTTFTVRMDAAAEGPYNGELSFANDDSDENPFNFTIGGYAGMPEIAVSAGGVDIVDDVGGHSFLVTPVGTPVDATFLVENTGMIDLTLVEPISLPAGFSVQSSFGALTVPPGGSTTFTIRMDAAAPGSYSGALSFGNNDGDENPFSFNLSGQVGSWEIAVSAGGSDIADGTGAVDFGATPVGTPVDITFTVSNSGTLPLGLVEPISPPAGFSVQSSFGALTLPPGDSTTFTVRLDAAAAGSYSGELSFGNGDPDENPFNFTVSGDVGSPEIAVSAGGNDIPDGSGTAGFGITPLGTPVDVDFTVSNTGMAPLTLVEPVGLPAGFSLHASFGALTVPPGGATVFTVRLDASAPGSYSGELSFGNNDSDENPFNFTVSGDVGSPEIAVSVDGHNIPDGAGPIGFGVTPPGTPVDRTFTISNTGTVDLVLVEPISLPAGFSVQSTFGALIVPAGGSTTFTVRLAAAATGVYQGMLSFGNSDEDENPFNFTIRGAVARRVFLPIVLKAPR